MRELDPVRFGDQPQQTRVGIEGPCPASLLDAETMTKARETRAAITLKSCTANPDELAGLAAQQDAIRSALPASPNERLVYRCQPASGAAVKPAAAP